MITWSEIKTNLLSIYGQYVGDGKLIESESGSPSQAAFLIDLIHNRIIGWPHEFEFLKENATITLPGTAEVDLASLLPDLKQVYQIYGILSNQESKFSPNYQANVIPTTGSYSLRNNTAYFTGTIPTGTAQVQYKSKYMVKSAAGVRKQYFTDDDDYSVLDSSDLNVLYFGFGQFVNWTADDTAKERRRETAEWFKEAFTNLVLANKNTKQINSLL